MNRGKTIRIYLVDGMPTSTLTAEIINWTGKVLVTPRSQLADLAKRDAHRTGVYFLAGPDPDSPGRECVYIGESDDVLTRLANHDRKSENDFWTRTFIVVSKDENLTKAHVRYLESRLIQKAGEARRARVMNNTSPPRPGLPEADVADMEYFLDQIVMILPVINLTVLQPHPHAAAAISQTATSPIFLLKQASMIAKAHEINGEFVVLKGSTARKEGVKSWTSYRSQRDQLIEDGRLVDSNEPEYLVFDDDVAFSSPSAAAAVVLGRNSNGRIEWKVVDTGKTYADWQALQLKRAGVYSQADED